MILHRRIKCFGVGESHLEAMLPDLIARQREPLVGITVSDATITLRITASGTDEAACRRAIEPTELEIRQTLGDLVFGEEADELENAAVRLLAEQDLSLAVCEWATGGLIAERLENAGLRLPAVVIADVSHAAQLLNCELSDGLEPHDPTLAVALAEAVRSRTGADVGLAVAAFPTDVDAPDARLGAAVAIAGKTRRVRLPCAAHPAIRRPRAASPCGTRPDH